MADLESREIRLDTAGIRHFMETLDAAMTVLDAAGYGRFRGTPVGYLLDVPAVSEEVSRQLSRISKEKPGRAWYEAIVHLERDGILATITFPGNRSSGRNHSD